MEAPSVGPIYLTPFSGERSTPNRPDIVRSRYFDVFLTVGVFYSVLCL